MRMRKNVFGIFEACIGFGAIVGYTFFEYIGSPWFIIGGMLVGLTVALISIHTHPAHHTVELDYDEYSSYLKYPKKSKKSKKSK